MFAVINVLLNVKAVMVQLFGLVQVLILAIHLEIMNEVGHSVGVIINENIFINDII